MATWAAAVVVRMSFDFKAPGQELYNYDPTLVDASTYDAAKLSDMDIAEYMNPYTDSVIDSTMADLDKARLTALNSTGAAASRGGAFGGDRHGIMEAQNNATTCLRWLARPRSFAIRATRTLRTRP